MSVSDFCSAIAANWISVLAPAALVALYYRFFGRRRFLAFFGLDGSRAVTVYVSNLNVPSGTAVALDGAARSYSGGAVPEYEVRLLPTLHRTFNLLAAGTDRLPDVLKRILASDIEVNVVAAPTAIGALDADATIVAVGGAAYNSAAARLATEFRPLANVTADGASLQVEGASEVMRDLRVALVQRAIHPSTGQVAFYLVGLSATGTTAAVHFLAHKWRWLHRRFGATKPFCVVLHVTSDDGRQYTVVKEIERT